MILFIWERHCLYFCSAEPDSNEYTLWNSINNNHLPDESLARNFTRFYILFISWTLPFICQRRLTGKPFYSLDENFKEERKKLGQFTTDIYTRNAKIQRQITMQKHLHKSMHLCKYFKINKKSMSELFLFLRHNLSDITFISEEEGVHFY